MKTLAEFRSDKFPPCDEDERINPGIWGKRLADYLVAHLATHGLIADMPIAEDWGWYIPVEVDSAALALCCGHQDGDDDEFLVFTDPAQPVTSKWFRTRDVAAQLARLLGALETILSTDPDIRGLSWRAP